MTSAFVCEGEYLTISLIDCLIIILFLSFIRELSLGSLNDICIFFFISEKRKMRKKFVFNILDYVSTKFKAFIYLWFKKK